MPGRKEWNQLEITGNDFFSQMHWLGHLGWGKDYFVAIAGGKVKVPPSSGANGHCSFNISGTASALH